MRNVFYRRENTGSQICWAWLHKVHSVLGGPLFQGKVSNVIVIFPLGFVVLMWVSINSLRSHLFCNVLGSYSGICWTIGSFGHLATFLFPNSSLFQGCPSPSIPFPPYSTREVLFLFHHRLSIATHHLHWHWSRVLKSWGAAGSWCENYTMCSSAWLLTLYWNLTYKR